MNIRRRQPGKPPADIDCGPSRAVSSRSPMAAAFGAVQLRDAVVPRFTEDHPVKVVQKPKRRQGSRASKWELA